MLWRHLALLVLMATANTAKAANPVLPKTGWQGPLWRLPWAVSDADSDAASFSLLQHASAKAKASRSSAAAVVMPASMTQPTVAAPGGVVLALPTLQNASATNSTIAAVPLTPLPLAGVGRNVQLSFKTLSGSPHYFTGEASTTIQPSGSDIWNSNSSWSRVKQSHPVGVISNLDKGAVRWADVSYISLNGLLTLTLVAYPVFMVLVIIVLLILVSACLVLQPENERPKEWTVAHTAAPDSAGIGADRHGRYYEDPVFDPPTVPKELLTPTSQTVYACWTHLCHAVPSLMVFGAPVLMICCARPYPQEVFSVLTLLTSSFIFSNGIYMVVFGGSAILRMRTAMGVDYARLLSKPPGSSPQSLKGCWQEVTHWVIVPQYKESVEVVSMTLSSVSQSPIARSNISILLAMEERDDSQAERAAKLRDCFQDKFKEMFVSCHPANLPNDPPGKASNLSWAFKELMVHLREDGRDLSQVLLTVADADSEFSAGYFECLTSVYLQQPEEERSLRIWQSPVLHLKNYHRVPSPVTVGTMFTCMQEMASLADPNSLCMPYSTYSLSLDLARRVGGWDPEWIAEDYHMGIKCFLLTLGRARVDHILLPVVNYMPEADSWIGTIFARWAQAKRHALGFSDLSYYLSMLPLLFGSRSDRSDHSNAVTMTGFWRMVYLGTALIVRLVNLHVVIGVLSTYGLFQTVLRFVMVIGLSKDRHVMFLWSRTKFCPMLLMICSIVCTLCCSTLFLHTYTLMKDRIEGRPMSSKIMHWLRNAVYIAVFGPFYFLGLGMAIWIAAVKTLFMRAFEYEVAPKPAAQSVLPPPPTPIVDSSEVMRHRRAQRQAGSRSTCVAS